MRRLAFALLLLLPSLAWAADPTPTPPALPTPPKAVPGASMDAPTAEDYSLALTTWVKENTQVQTQLQFQLQAELAESRAKLSAAKKQVERLTRELEALKPKPDEKKPEEK